MATDQSLATLLRTLQSASGEQDVSRLLESVTNLFTLLSNPSNVSLLTSQLLSAPAIWSIPTYGQSIVRVVNVFASASIRVIRRQEASDDSRLDATRRSLGLNDWTVAVVKGASVGAPRSRHVLVFAGLLQGFENQRRRGISTSLHAQIQDALITATNSSLRESAQRSNVTDQGLIFAVGLIFDTLATRRKTHLDHDLLLPTLTSAVFFSDDGLRQGYFLSPIDADIVEEAGQKFHWSIKSPSYRQLQSVTSSPLVASLGRLSRVAAFSVGQVKDTAVLTRLLQDSFEFSRSLSLQWRQNKLSEIDASEEMLFLSEETLRTPVPLLWRVLRISMFAIVVILSSCTGRLLSGDFQGEHDAPSSAAQMLKILRHLSFISFRLGTDTLSQYSFVYLTAIDALSQYPMHVEGFLADIRPAETGRIPQHPLDRSMDLYFLNAAEHFAFVLDTNTAKELLLPAASPYLSVNGDPRLIPMFEAAHSVMLAVLATPHNIELAACQVASYANLLFQVFPQLLSPRQFGLAIRQLVRLTSPPSKVSEQRPLLPSTLLEILHSRIESATPRLLVGSGTVDVDGNNAEPMSEQSALVHALIDSLPCLAVEALEDWLPTTARSIRLIKDPALRNAAKLRFWEVLSNGEMDVNRAAVCVTWWGTKGGRELLLYERDDTVSAPLMSGALNESSKL